MTNAYQEVLKITAPPRLEQVKDHPEASSYSLLIAALIERGGPMTLSEVAERFAAAGVATADEALAALRRCRPARPPVHRDGEHYSLDPHHDEADLWAFRLGLRPPKVTRVAVTRPEPPPLPGADVRLTVAELDEAWKDASLNSTSARQVALAVLDAHGGPMPPDEVVAAVRARTRWHALTADSTKFKPRGSPIEVDADGRWAIVPGHAALGVARSAVRDRIAASRRAVHARPDPAVNAASMRAAQEMRDAHAAELAKLSRVILYGFPEARPEALALLDVGERTIAAFLREEIADVPRRLAGFDVIAGIDVRGLLRGIGVDPSGLRLAELGPAQKTMKLNKRGRTLKITAELLIQGSCGISRPFAPDSLRAYLDAGDDNKARRRLEADVKSLYALHEYGRLHHTVRLRWGFLDERLPAPWRPRVGRPVVPRHPCARRPGGTDVGPVSRRSGRDPCPQGGDPARTAGGDGALMAKGCFAEVGSSGSRWRVVDAEYQQGPVLEAEGL